MSVTAVIAANRFGLGTRPGEIKDIEKDPKGWLHSQLKAETSLPAPLRDLPSTVDDLTAFRKWFASIAGKAKAAGVELYPAKIGTMTPEAEMSQTGFSIEGDYIKTFTPRYARAVKARFDTAIETDRPFFERLVHFWSNHFVVSGAKAAAVALPPSFERDVIRPNVTGKFADMLLASSKHPAMLFYLDNYLSTGPDSKIGRDPSLHPATGELAKLQQSSGLNENLAREICELHTVGVNGGYDQTDVTNFAKIITGWTIARPQIVRPLVLAVEGRLNGKGLFQFDDDTHQPGAQRFMGKIYDQQGVAQGEAVLNDLARHPATAHFIATKLARHFCSDDPPQALVDRLAAIFRETDGDLGKVTAALIDSPEPFASPFGKFRQPEEYLIAAVRGMPGLEVTPRELLQTFHGLGQPVYKPPGPNGWPDVSAEWLAPDSLWKRFEWAGAAAARYGNSGRDPVQLAEDLLGPTLNDATRRSIGQAESPAQGLTLMLASAEFQWR